MLINKIVKDAILSNCPYPERIILSKTRKRDITQWRQIWQTALKKFSKLSYAEVGAEIGSKDHATIMHAEKTINDLCDTDKKIKAIVEDVYKNIEQSISAYDTVKQDFDNMFYTSEHSVDRTVERESGEIFEYIKFASHQVATNLGREIIENNPVERIEQEERVRYKVELFVAKRYQLKAYVDYIISTMPLDKILEIRSSINS